MRIKNQIVASIKTSTVRARIQKRDFTIVSNNCWGAHVYQLLGKPYTTPFVGVFVPPDCYIRLISRLRWYLAQPMRFVDSSTYDYVNAFRAQQALDYPIGCLGEDVEIQFLHYSSEEDATEKWNRRVQRITTDDSRLFFKFCDRDGCSSTQIAAFNALPLTNKVCFVSKPYPDLECAVCIPSCGDGQVPDGLQLSRISPKHFDTAGWICGSSTKPRWWTPRFV
jgi:uncharacterized protein (DUF1919 family)